MKRIVFFGISVFAIALINWQCSDKNDVDNLELKASLKSTSAKLNHALVQIKSTPGYQLLTLQYENNLKSAATEQSDLCVADSIDLDDIKGVYEYKPASFNKWCFYCYDRLFTRTGDSDFLVVKMPKEKIFSPHKFHNVVVADSLLKNNFIITASDYHYYFTKGYYYDYKLSTTCDLDSVRIGELLIRSSREKPSNRRYSAIFGFNNGYNINVFNSSGGDTAISSIGLSDANGILLKETVKKIKINGKHREKEYILSIGNVDIRRMPAKDSIEIYVSGVLQQNTKVEFIDNDSIEEKSICKKRDIQITFDDGSQAKVSELIGPALTTVATLVESMKNLYFASNVIDYIAINIKKNKGCK